MNTKQHYQAIRQRARMKQVNVWDAVNRYRRDKDIVLIVNEGRKGNDHETDQQTN